MTTPRSAPVPGPRRARVSTSRVALRGALLVALVAGGAPAARAAAQTPSAPHGDTLVVATYAYATNDRLANIAPLAAYLGDVLGRPVRTASLPDPGALARAMKQGEVDVAVMNTFGYLLRAAAPVPAGRPVATFHLPEGTRSNYGTTLVARRASPPACATLPTATVPCSLVLVAPGSTTGNLVPRLYLAANGVPEPERRYRSVSYAGTHAGALARLRRGEGDVAALATEELDRALAGDPALRDELQELWRSGDIALGPIVVRSTLPAPARTDLARAIVGLERQAPDVFLAVRDGWVEARQSDGLVAANDASYDGTRRMFGDPGVAAQIIAQFAK